MECPDEGDPLDNILVIANLGVFWANIWSTCI
jgi:hypothetical protein